jgi:hypothetical protein
VAGVRVRRATWTSGNSMAWNYIEGEPAVLHLALSRFSEDKTNALGLPPDKAAVLNEVFRLAETPDISFVQREQRPLQQALEKEGSRRRQEALEQRMCLSVQRFVVQVDDLMRKQIARVKETLSEEQYKALLALGGRRGNP